MNGFERLVPEVGITLEAISGHYDVHDEARVPDCVVGFSFGYRGKPPNVKPGLSNEDLASVIWRHYAKLPKILQFEIADAYRELEPKASNVLRIEKHRAAGKYLDTREVAEQAKAFMDHEGWKTAVLVAHPCHVPRADAVCQELGIQTTVTEALRGAVEFDPQSSQKQTRSLAAWREYEPEAIELYHLRGWL